MRIKYSLLPKLRNLTNREMDFFLYLARCQDRAGLVIGVHNQEVCRATGMCKQSFYTSMRGLEAKNIISCTKKDNDYDVLILGNDFPEKDTWKEGYISLQRKVFHQKQFKGLKSNEKYMLMELLKRSNESSKSSYHIYTYNFYAKFKDLLGVTKRVIRAYLHAMKKFFSIGIKNGQYYITYRRSVFHQKIDRHVDDQDYEYFVKAQCRRNRIRYTADSLKDTADLFKTYRPLYAGIDLTLRELREMVADAICKSVENKEPLDRRLNQKYVHKLLREDLFPKATVSDM